MVWTQVEWGWYKGLSKGMPPTKQWGMAWCHNSGASLKPSGVEGVGEVMAVNRYEKTSWSTGPPTSASSVQTHWSHWAVGHHSDLSCSCLGCWNHYAGEDSHSAYCIAGRVASAAALTWQIQTVGVCGWLGSGAGRSCLPWGGDHGSRWFQRAGALGGGELVRTRWDPRDGGCCSSDGVGVSADAGEMVAGAAGTGTPGCGAGVGAELPWGWWSCRADPWTPTLSLERQFKTLLISATFVFTSF